MLDAAARRPPRPTCSCVAHGWNNDMAEARGALSAPVRQRPARARRPAAPRASPARRIGVLGVLWPSKKFAERRADPGRRRQPRRRGRRPGARPSSSTISRAPSTRPTRRRSRRPRRWCRGSRAIPARASEFVDLRALGAARARGPGRRRLGRLLRALPARRSSRCSRRRSCPDRPAGGAGGGAAAIGLAEAGPPPGMASGRRRRHRRLLRRHQGGRAPRCSTSRPTTR